MVQAKTLSGIILSLKANPLFFQIFLYGLKNNGITFAPISKGCFTEVRILKYRMGTVRFQIPQGWDYTHWTWAGNAVKGPSVGKMFRSCWTSSKDGHFQQRTNCAVGEVTFELGRSKKWSVTRIIAFFICKILCGWKHLFSQHWPCAALRYHSMHRHDPEIPRRKRKLIWTRSL